ncbi:MAG: hypothetical protein IID35_03555 [Planctomycetes bacterium]|nr:hypothetical protein [Planctomycetota bacterium]
MLLALSLSVPALAFVYSYEGTFVPEDFMFFERIVGGKPERRLEDGWFIQTFQESGQDFYRKDIGGNSRFVGRFFVEWRAMTDNPEWLIDEWQVTAVVVAGGNAGTFYHVVMTESAAVLLRDVSIPRVIVPISVGEPHTYRIEVYSDEYVWYIDGVVVDSGVPEGPYPDPNASVTWGGRWHGFDAEIAWDYVRFGDIPEDASGNYDCDFGKGPKGPVDEVAPDDYRFFVECMTNDGPDLFGGPENNAGPGCRFADFDFDGDIDLFDFAEFANHYTGFLP